MLSFLSVSKVEAEEMKGAKKESFKLWERDLKEEVKLIFSADSTLKVENSAEQHKN